MNSNTDNLAVEMGREALREYLAADPNPFLPDNPAHAFWWQGFIAEAQEAAAAQANKA